VISVPIASFEIRAHELKWLSVSTRDQGEQARLLDVITEIEKREGEEACRA
jgi:hypothetical protein